MNQFSRILIVLSPSPCFLSIPCWGHGGGVGTSAGGLGQLAIIVVAAITLFSLFLVFAHQKKGWSILITGGGGYIGSALIPKLLKNKNQVTVLDPFLNNGKALEKVEGYVSLKKVKGDLADIKTLERALDGCDAIIHLAHNTDMQDEIYRSNNNSQNNAKTFHDLVKIAKKAGVKRFINASSFEVYGNSIEDEATEEHQPNPLTSFAKYKLLCENILEKERTPGFVTCTVRSGVAYGRAPYTRLDLIVNAMVYSTVKNRHITINNKAQNYPIIHINDITDLYLIILSQADAQIDGKTFNAVGQNLTAIEIGNIVNDAVDQEIRYDIKSQDNASTVRMSSYKARKGLGFETRYTLQKSVHKMVAEFRNKLNS